MPFRNEFRHLVLGAAALLYALTLVIHVIRAQWRLTPFSPFGWSTEILGVAFSVGSIGAIILIAPARHKGTLLFKALTSVALGLTAAIAFLRYFSEPLAVLAILALANAFWCATEIEDKCARYLQVISLVLLILWTIYVCAGYLMVGT